MTKSFFLSSLALCLSLSDAATRVAVLEFGNGGAVRRTTAKNTESTVEGVASFWDALHSPVRKLQHAGMTVVPDLFKKADTGVVVAISGPGVDLDKMPTVSSLVSEEDSNVVGHMEIPGSHSAALMSKVPELEGSDVSSLVDKVKAESKKGGLSGVSTLVNAANAFDLDEQVKTLVSELNRSAAALDTRIVVHLVVEEEEESSRRRELSRRLDEEADEEDQGDNNNENGNNANGQQYDGYYGYGYYNAYGEWVTPYKTMFQIQYFNVVFWTAIGLVIVVIYTIGLFLDMPLEPDTLLFGESAKMVGDD